MQHTKQRSKPFPCFGSSEDKRRLPDSGIFFTENDTTESIAEALGVVSDWNPGWCPKYFFTDLCEQEINAIETTFSSESTGKEMR